jgi:hypothetical protein
VTTPPGTGPAVVDLRCVEISGRHALVTGRVTTDRPPATVAFGGAISGSVTTDDRGAFSYPAGAVGLGTIVAVATDGGGATSALAFCTLDTAVPTVTVQAEIFPNRTVELRGRAYDELPAGLAVAFTGAAAGRATTGADATYEATLTGAVPGKVTATVTDRWGRTGAADVVLPEQELTITRFGMIPSSGQTWLVTGQVQGTPNAGLVVRFSSTGVTSISGKTAAVNSNGSFSLLVTLAPGENGVVSAVVQNYWNLDSEPRTTVVQQP